MIGHVVMFELEEGVHVNLFGLLGVPFEFALLGFKNEVPNDIFL